MLDALRLFYHADFANKSFIELRHSGSSIIFRIWGGNSGRSVAYRWAKQKFTFWLFLNYCRSFFDDDWNRFNFERRCVIACPWQKATIKYKKIEVEQAKKISHVDCLKISVQDVVVNCICWNRYKMRPTENELLLQISNFHDKLFVVS